MRYMISVSYDGSEFYGFQRLNNLNTIQKCLEDALSKINKEKVFIKGSGRTDRGVHALNQVCHFDLNVNISCERLVNAINSLLPNSIYVNNCKITDNNFHARFNVKKKEYMYVINIGQFDCIRDKYIYNYCKELDLNLMKEASNILIGKHNYQLFVSGKRDNYNSEIFKIEINKEKNFIILKFIGKSFYRYMVRNLTGALIMIGSKKISIDDFANCFANNIKINYMTVPANGLYLNNVYY